MEQKLPWLDYTGQTAPELVACKATHRIDSLLCAFEEGIQNHLAQQGAITGDERLVLAIMALVREVNNGGHHQFFLNSSCEYAPVILDSLLCIGCAATAAIVSDAIASLGVPIPSVEAISAVILNDDPVRDRILKDCDRKFYSLDEITPNLFQFIESRQHEIRLVKALVPPHRHQPSQFPNLPKLQAHLLLSKPTDHRLDSVRHLTRSIAREKEIPASEPELERAAVGHALRLALRADNLDACQTLAQQAFELMPEDTTQSVLRRTWVEKLLSASRPELADAATMVYLRYLKDCEMPPDHKQKSLQFWARPLQKHRDALPNSARFFQEHFPSVDVDQPRPSPIFRYPPRKKSTQPQ